MEEQAYQLPLSSRIRIWSAPLLLQARYFYRECIEDIPLITRVASHIGLFVLMVLTVAASGLQLSAGEKIASAAFAPASDDAVDNPQPVEPQPETGFLSLAPVPITDVPKRVRRDVVKYTVEGGDTVSGIASQFEISADSVLWANPKLEDNPDLLSVGQVLNIPPISGVLYSVQAGDTLQKIAEKFRGKKKADTIIENIIKSEFNQEHQDLKSGDSQPAAGQLLMVPGGYKPYIPRVVYAYSGPIPASAARGTGAFGWPVSGVITQKFWQHHPGIDIGAPKGTSVYSADSGYVVVAGWDQERISYGFMILVNHGNGYITRYAHLSAMNVDVGDSVKKGQLIGRVGSTGNSTGPHLHFEIIQGGGHRNPFSFLPGR